MSYKNIRQDVWVEETPSVYKFTARDNSAYISFEKDKTEDVYKLIEDVRKNKQTDNHARYSDTNVSLFLEDLKRKGVNIYGLNRDNYSANNWFCKKLDIVIEYLSTRVLTFDTLKTISNRETIKELLKDYSIKFLERILKEANI